MTERICAGPGCNEPLPSWVARNALYHSQACRKAASRARLGQRHGWGGTQERRDRRKRAAARDAVTGE